MSEENRFAVNLRFSTLISLINGDLNHFTACIHEIAMMFLTLL